MLKKLFTVVIICLVIVLLILAYFGGLWQNKEKIHAAELEMEQLRSMRDSLLTVVAYRDSLELLIGEQISSKKDEAEVLRQEVSRLEEVRKEKQFTIRSLRKKEDIQNKFKETFPEVANSDWGVTEVFNEKYGVGIEYLLIPLWFNETFIIDHNNSKLYQAQKDKLLLVDSLNQFVIILQDSVLVLEKLNRKAYENGYNTAYVKYEELNQKYISELQKGKIDWGLQAAGFVGGGVIGVLIGRGTK
ncbi:MAG: hypothetical protein A2V93_00940 [Ignavibacteria bacterium RBG_16_34_14]|nr:MAG: hypothetical protein A2V93_00940 [Ignavibacteria bacterium RBG_16_34_14]